MTRIATKTVGEKGVKFAFADGEALIANIDGLPADIIQKLALHGLSQKIGDSYAGAESINEARESAVAVWGNLQAGLWAAKASRGGKIVEALSRATGKDIDACLEKYTGMTDAQKKELRKHPDIKHALAEIEAERAATLAQAAGDSGDDLTALFN